MNLHQLRYLQEAVRRNLNLTETARALHTSQPGISKAILELEEELGVNIFVRHGKRLRRVSAAGQEVLKAVDVIMREVGNLKRIGEEFSRQDAGRLSIATTHTQARYVLPEPVVRLRQKYPNVQVSLHQGTPEQVARLLLEDAADIGLATESLADFDDLVTLPCYEWQHVLLTRADHPLAQVQRPTLEQLAQHPLITYQSGFAGRTRIDQAFAQRRLKPQVAIEAIDSDVIKTYVRNGLGVGIVAEMAMRAELPGGAASGALEGDLVAQPCAHLFGNNTARIAFRRGAHLRGYTLAFAESLSQHLTKALIVRAISGQGASYEL